MEEQQKTPQRTGRQRRSIWSYFVIEQRFKQRQILRLIGLSLLNVAVSTVAFVAFMQYELSAVQGGLPMSAGPSPGLIRIAIVWAAFMSGLGGLFALLTGILMTHRMAGPIYKFKMELDRIRDGHPPRYIGVRKGDEFADVAEALNGALDALHTRAGNAGESGALALDLEQMRATHQQILEGLEALDVTPLPEADRARVEGWRERMLALREKLDA
jgi:methyl-accepting chemotaxis protein